MKNKILLIQPQNTLSLNVYPPLNLILIGTSLKKKGYDVRIITAPTTVDYKDSILQQCEDALFVGIGVLTPEVPHAIEIARSIKKSNFYIPIVWGGWHATLFPKQMSESKLVDKVVVDEGDESIVEIAEEYRENGYKGIEGNKIIKSKSKLDMENLPCPDFSLVSNIEQYINSFLYDPFLKYDHRKIRWVPYQASRGCPSKCTFCINVVTDNRKYRTKSAEKVVDEIEFIVRKYKINHLKIIDDNLFVRIDWIKDIANKLIRKKLDLTWDAECRVDYYNDKMLNDDCLKLLVKSGLNEMTFGVESGSQRSLDIIKKGITPAQSLYAVKKNSKFGIVSRCSFIIDIPGEEREDILETVKLINKIRQIPKTFCAAHTYRPYPKSVLCEDLIKKGIIKQPKTFEDWAKAEFIEQFTYSGIKRKWLKNYKLSSKISFYQNLESGFWLMPHEIGNRWVKKINHFFMKIAKVRNSSLFYEFGIDQHFYSFFKFIYIKYREKKCKTSC